MANYAHIGNNIYVGLTTDTKPTAANTANGAICIEWATNYAIFTIYINNQTSWLPQTAFTETYTNKTMSGASNTFSNIPDAALPTTLAGKTLTTPILNGVTYGDVAITNASSPYTVLATTKVIRADATSGAITINLPTAVGIAGREYHIFRTDVAGSTNVITIDANSTETIDSSLTYRLYTGEWVKLESDGANWQVIGSPNPSIVGYYFKRGTGSPGNRRYIGSSFFNNSITTSTTAPALNTLFAYPFHVARTIVFDTISFFVSTLATAGGVARAGIYTDNGNAYPGALYFDTGSIATDAGSTTLPRDTTITSSLQVFQPGLYWLAWECGTAAPQVRILGGAATCLTFGGYGSDMAAGTAPPYAYSVAHTFGALPDPYTAGASNITAQSAVGAPQIALALRPV